MRMTYRIVLAALLLALFAPPAAAQIDLSGSWQMNSSAFLDGANEPCVFVGGGTLQQSGSEVTGDAFLNLVSGPAECPPVLTGQVMGSVDGLDFGGMIDGGQLFGGLNFVAAISEDGRSLMGSYTLKEGGPFTGVSDGTFTAQRQPEGPAIPTLGAWALVTLAGLLALAGMVFVYRMFG